MPTPFMTYSQQIAKLQAKGLQISDTVAAIKILKHIGYFQLIGGYKMYFKNPTTKQYKDTVTFNDIVALYHFDRNLRQLFLEYLLVIEKAIKTQIAYCFCNQYGELQSHYLTPSNYQTTTTNRQAIAKLISKLRNLCTQPSKYPYISYHQNKYGNVPLWVLINAITFGSMSKMYGFLSQSIQSQIAQDFPLHANQLESMLRVLTNFRNVCAHGERLFTYETKKDAIHDLLLHQKMNIPKKNGQYIKGKNDLFSVLISLRYLLPNGEFKQFKKQLSNQITNFIRNFTIISEHDLLDLMGFPLDWKKMSRYRVLK